MGDTGRKRCGEEREKQKGGTYDGGNNFSGPAAMPSACIEGLLARCCGGRGRWGREGFPGATAGVLAAQGPTRRSDTPHPHPQPTTHPRGVYWHAPPSAARPSLPASSAVCTMSLLKCATLRRSSLPPSLPPPSLPPSAAAVHHTLCGPGPQLHGRHLWHQRGGAGGGADGADHQPGDRSPHRQPRQGVWVGWEHGPAPLRFCLGGGPPLVGASGGGARLVRPFPCGLPTGSRTPLPATHTDTTRRGADPHPRHPPSCSSQVLHAKRADQRAATYQQTLRTGGTFVCCSPLPLTPSCIALPHTHTAAHVRFCPARRTRTHAHAYPYDPYPTLPTPCTLPVQPRTALPTPRCCCCGCP